MVFFILLSKLPLSDPRDLLKKNQITLGLGLALYGLSGALIFSGKIDQFLSSLPDKKYLLGIILVDLILYFLLHRFEYGLFPPFSAPEVPQNKIRSSNRPKPNINYSRTTHQPQKIANNNQQQKKKYSEKQDDEEDDDISSLTTNLRDDIDSVYKQNVVPEDASLPGQEYFKKNDQVLIQNWDLDEFTQEEYVPDVTAEEMSYEDEVILEA